MIKIFLVVDESLHKWQSSACLETLQPKPQSLGYHQCQRRELFEHCQILRTPWHCHSLRMSRGIFFIRKFFGIFLSFLKKNFKCFFFNSSGCPTPRVEKWFLLKYHTSRHRRARKGDICQTFWNIVEKKSNEKSRWLSDVTFNFLSCQMSDETEVKIRFFENHQN